MHWEKVKQRLAMSCLQEKTIISQCDDNGFMSVSLKTSNTKSTPIISFFFFLVQFFKAKLLRVHSDKYEIADIIVNAAVNSTWNVKLEDNIPCLCARKTNTSFTEAQNHEKKKRMFLLRYETYGTGLYLKSTVAHRI